MSARSYRYECFDGATAIAVGAAAGGAMLDEDLAELHHECEKARQRGFDAGQALGFAEGRNAALQEVEAKLVERLPQALAQLSEAVLEMQAAKQSSQQDAILLVRAVLRQLLPKLADRAFSLELAAQVEGIVAGAQAPNIEIRCSERTRNIIRRLCGPLPAGVEIVADPALGEASLACAWADGGAHFSAEAVIHAVSTIIERCLDEAQISESQSGQA